MWFEDISIDQTAIMSFGITDNDVNLFINLTQDRNPVHEGNGMVHGMLIASYISEMIGEVLPGNGSIWVSHNIRFIEPIYRGDYITIKASITNKVVTNNQVRLFVDVINQDDKTCLLSTCWVKVPSKEEMYRLVTEYDSQVFMGEVSTPDFNDWLKLRENG